MKANYLIAVPFLAVTLVLTGCPGTSPQGPEQNTAPKATTETTPTAPQSSAQPVVQENMQQTAPQAAQASTASSSPAAAMAQPGAAESSTTR